MEIRMDLDGCDFYVGRLGRRTVELCVCELRDVFNIPLNTKTIYIRPFKVSRPNAVHLEIFEERSLVPVSTEKLSIVHLMFRITWPTRAAIYLLNKQGYKYFGVEY